MKKNNERKDSKPKKEKTGLRVPLDIIFLKDSLEKGNPIEVLSLGIEVRK